jgi:hypothetical protein
LNSICLTNFQDAWKSWRQGDGVDEERQQQCRLQEVAAKPPFHLRKALGHRSVGSEQE